MQELIAYMGGHVQSVLLWCTIRLEDTKKTVRTGLPRSAPLPSLKREHLAGPAKFRHAGRLAGSHPLLFILLYWQKADPSMVWCSGTFVCGSHSTSHTHWKQSCCFLQCSGILALWDPSDRSMRPLRSTPSRPHLSSATISLVPPRQVHKPTTRVSSPWPPVQVAGVARVGFVAPTWTD